MKKYFPNHIPAFFAGIDPAALDALLSSPSTVERDFLRGETLLRAGDPCRIGVVLSGRVQIIQEDLWGNRSVIGLAGEGDLFGEAFVCAGLLEMPVGVLGAEPGTVLLIDGAFLLAPDVRDPINQLLLQNLLQIVSAKAVGLIRKAFFLSRRTTRDKLLAYLSAQAALSGSREFCIPFDRQQLADYLAVDRSAMSAELGKLRREGILDFNRSAFVLYDPQDA